jgi:hypothetical protein
MWKALAGMAKNVFSKSNLKSVASNALLSKFRGGNESNEDSNTNEVKEATINSKYQSSNAENIIRKELRKLDDDSKDLGKELTDSEDDLDKFSEEENSNDTVEIRVLKKIDELNSKKIELENQSVAFDNVDNDSAINEINSKIDKENKVYKKIVNPISKRVKRGLTNFLKDGFNLPQTLFTKNPKSQIDHASQGFKLINDKLEQLEINQKRQMLELQLRLMESGGLSLGNGILTDSSNSSEDGGIISSLFDMLKTGVMTTVGEKVGTKVLGGIARKVLPKKIAEKVLGKVAQKGAVEVAEKVGVKVAEKVAVVAGERVALRTAEKMEPALLVGY